MERKSSWRWIPDIAIALALLVFGSVLFGIGPLFSTAVFAYAVYAFYRKNLKWSTFVAALMVMLALGELVSPTGTLPTFSEVAARNASEVAARNANSTDPLEYLLVQIICMALLAVVIRYLNAPQLMVVMAYLSGSFAIGLKNLVDPSLSFCWPLALMGLVFIGLGACLKSSDPSTPSDNDHNQLTSNVNPVFSAAYSGSYIAREFLFGVASMVANKNAYIQWLNISGLLLFIPCLVILLLMGLKFLFLALLNDFLSGLGD